MYVTTAPNFKELFAQRCKAVAQTTRTRVIVKSGKLIFRVSDILKTVNPIAKLLRMIFVDRRITDDQLNAAHFEFERREGKLSRDINTSRNNAKKMLAKDRVTVQQFEKMLTILNLRIVDMGYTLQDLETGEVKEYKISDIEKFLAEHQNELSQEESVNITEFSGLE